MLPHVANGSVYQVRPVTQHGSFVLSYYVLHIYRLWVISQNTRQQNNRAVSVSPFEGKESVNDPVLWGTGEAAQEENKAAAPRRNSQIKIKLRSFYGGHCFGKDDFN